MNHKGVRIIAAIFLSGGMTAFGIGLGPIATAASAAGLGVNLDQCANKTAPCKWQNGNLNASNSAYHEGETVPFRLLIRGLTPGPHSIHVGYEFTANGKYAYDVLSTYNLSETVDIKANLSGAYSSFASGVLAGAASTYSLPHDPYFDTDSGPGNAGFNPEGDLSAAQRKLTIFGGSITGIDAPTHSGSSNGNSSADMVVHFTTIGSSAALLWGAHLARGTSAWGAGFGASSISGAPWHGRTQNLDGSGRRNQDRSIGSSAIVDEASLSVTKTADAASVEPGTDIGFVIEVTNDGPGTAVDVTLSDPLQTDDGISWSIAGTTGDPDCSIAEDVLTCSGGTMSEGSSFSVHVTSATTSESCGEYVNTATATAVNAASATGSATTTVACDQVDLGTPHLKIQKSAISTLSVAGHAIGFVISVANDGDAEADNLHVTDTLPTNAGLAWTITGGDDASACEIEAGVLTCDAETLPAGESLSVQIGSPTTAQTCGDITNTAYAGADDIETIHDGATIKVTCVEAVRVGNNGSVNGSTHHSQSAGNGSVLQSELAKTGISPLVGLFGLGFVALGMLMLVVSRRKKPLTAR